MTPRDTELAGRERLVGSREKQIEARESALRVAEASYKSRITKLKELTGDAQ
jgi:hypothetical protein